MYESDTATRGPDRHPGPRGPRAAWADNLKVALVAGVIVAHATIAWTGVRNWVLTEPPVREPLFSALVLLSGLGALFGMPLFFLIAGIFTPRSLIRKGLRGFITGRAVRLGVPLLAFIILLAPFVEYWDSDNADWDRGLWALAVEVVWWAWPMPPAWGPTWFLAVLLAFSVAYAVVRSAVPARPGPARGPVGRGLVLLGLGVAAGSYLIRIEVPLGAEAFRLALGQAPGWVAGFVMGTLGAERGWYGPLEPNLARAARHVAWAAAACFAATIAVVAVTGADLAPFAGRGTWQSALVAVAEGAIVVATPLWLVDLFHRRANRAGPVLREASRAAFAAFLVHQAVLVALILMIRRVSWAPEPEYVLVTTLAVLASFTLAALLVRVPGAARVL